MVLKRIKQYIDSKGITVYSFEKQVGISNASFAHQLKKDGAVGSDKLENILNTFPDLSAEWLLRGVGEMEKKKESAKNTDTQRRGRVLPLLPFDAIAGPGAPVFSDEQVQDYYEVSEFRDSDFLIRVKGDSMTPRYTGGDLIACKKVDDVLFFQYGRVYVLCTKSQGVMIKRVQPSGKEDCILCVSDNVKYAPFEVPKEDITGVALVTGSISLE